MAILEKPDLRLTPCPLCGNPDVHLYSKDDFDLYFAKRGKRLWTWTAVCKNCECQLSQSGGLHEDDTDEDVEACVITRWNTRTAPKDFEYRPFEGSEKHLQKEVDDLRTKWVEERKLNLK